MGKVFQGQRSCVSNQQGRPVGSILFYIYKIHGMSELERIQGVSIRKLSSSKKPQTTRVNC